MNTTVREADGRQTEQFVAPSASVIETGDGYLLQIEMPGVGKEGVKISTEGNEPTIVGRRSQQRAIDRALIHHESRPENFRRTFELDPSIDVNKINAKVEQGLLTLTLPKAEHVNPRKIAVS
jgi:HSP20 family protein